MRKILVRVSKILVGFIAVMIVLLLSVAAGAEQTVAVFC